MSIDMMPHPSTRAIRLAATCHLHQHEPVLVVYWNSVHRRQWQHIVDKIIMNIVPHHHPQISYHLDDG